jgi:septum formation protein
VALENARRKARSARARAGVAAGEGEAADRGELVLAVDTLVALDGRIYGKPADEHDARATLLALAGRTHQVVSGLVIGDLEAVATTEVTFREVPDTWIDWYVATGEWRERAGGYAIQGRGAALVREIRGDYLNVVGLPVAALLDLAPDLLISSVF